MADDDPLGNVNQLEEELGIATGFLESLFKEDDWSFVIKTHALLEAALTHVLTVFVGEPRLERLFARLELSGATTGKVVLARDLNLLSEARDRRFIRSLSELRNDLVHDVRYVTFTFGSHLAQMDDAQVKLFRKNFDTWSVSETHEIASKKIPMVQFFREKPKLAIWYSAVSTLGTLYGMHQIHRDIRRQREEAKRWEGLMELAKNLGEGAKSPLPPIATLDAPAQEAASEDGEDLDTEGNAQADRES